MKVNFDLWGYCAKCHKKMYVEEIIDKKPTRRLLGDYAEEEVLLSDGSKMRIAMCMNCRNNLKEKDYKELMAVVFRGWEKEVIEISKWDDKKKREHLDRYSKLEIVTIARDKPKDVLDKKLKEYKKDKDK